MIKVILIMSTLLGCSSKKECLSAKGVMASSVLSGGVDRFCRIITEDGIQCTAERWIGKYYEPSVVNCKEIRFGDGL